VVIINVRCSLRIEVDERVIAVAGLPVHCYRANDAVAEACAMVFLVEQGFAQQSEVARAFGVSARTVHRHQTRHAEGGMAALGRESGWRHGRRRISNKRLRTIEALKNEGASNRTIAHRLGVTEKAIRKQVGPSSQSDLVQPSLIGTATETKPTVSGPSSGLIDYDVGRVAPLTDDGDDSADPLAAHAEDSEPVPMSLDQDPRIGRSTGSLPMPACSMMPRRCFAMGPRFPLPASWCPKGKDGGVVSGPYATLLPGLYHLEIDLGRIPGDRNRMVLEAGQITIDVYCHADPAVLARAVVSARPRRRQPERLEFEAPDRLDKTRKPMELEFRVWSAGKVGFMVRVVAVRLRGWQLSRVRPGRTEMKPWP